MILVVALVALNLWQAATRDVGPNPAEEALHTPQEAIAQCLAGIESRFASQRPAIVEPLQTEYLGGGEYDVSGTVELVEGSLRARHDVSCTAQFDATDGWTADEILLDTK
ncbi:MAG: hypothetical protein BMS9Abin29_1860 [Gemmatimonadota bacterium]|nr:MAG: hypothetical protein BMS9Abin29_1860 [Gemmatimonadota bacterium]